ncbi:hypothetical protein [Aquimarina rubra]|uniref:Uncharacterized protein n=1 Tax=Aquimarina rubra TaxID=1920033 RepID=A0ABW5LJ39_9FLAO
MNISELQNDIIKKVLSIGDKDFLESFKEMLSIKSETNLYELSDFEKKMVSESQSDYENGNIINHESVFNKNKKWLEE